MKKFVSLLTSMIVTLFVIGCSNPSSSSGGSLGMGGAEDSDFTLEQLTSGVNLTISDAYTKLISSSVLSSLNGKTVTIKVTDVTADSSVTDNWWFCANTSTKWVENIEWNDDSKCYMLTKTDFSSYTDGLYINGINCTATVTVSYK